MQQTTTHGETPSPNCVWLNATQVAERYGVSIPTVWTWARAKDGRLPQPHKLAENTTRWRLSELEAHDDELAERGTYEPKKRPRKQT
jgi:prophage regulatory protein